MNRQAETLLGFPQRLPFSLKSYWVQLVVLSLGTVSCKNTSPRPKNPSGDARVSPSPDSLTQGTNQNAQSCLTEYPFPGTYALSPSAIKSVPGDPSSSELGYSSAACAANAPVGVPSEADYLNLNIQDAPSPNYSDRGGASISGIVIHNTIGRFDGALGTLRNPNGADGNPNTGDRVSAHMLIGRNGRIAKLVDEKFAAWHAMQVNKSTLGIELEAWDQSQDITPEQERTLTALLSHWMTKYTIPREKITSHRTHVATSCPSFLWTTESDFLNWRTGLKLP